MQTPTARNITAKSSTWICESGFDLGLFCKLQGFFLRHFSLKKKEKEKKKDASLYRRFHPIRAFNEIRCETVTMTSQTGILDVVENRSDKLMSPLLRSKWITTSSWGSFISITVSYGMGLVSSRAMMNVRVQILVVDCFDSWTLSVIY